LISPKKKHNVEGPNLIGYSFSHKQQPKEDMNRQKKGWASHNEKVRCISNIKNGETIWQSTVFQSPKEREGDDLIKRSGAGLA